jgi:hypothetical protein
MDGDAELPGVPDPDMTGRVRRDELHLHDADGRYLRHCLDEDGVAVAELAGVEGEQVDAAEPVVTQPQGACAARNPRPSASAENAGQRALSTEMSGTSTDSSTWNASRHGPSSAPSWASLTSIARSPVDATTCRYPFVRGA